MANDKTETKAPEAAKTETKAFLSYADLEKSHGAKAGAVWAEICKLGGWGTVPATHEGGLSFADLPADVLTAIDKLLKEGK